MFRSAVSDLHLGSDDIASFREAVSQLETIWSSGILESFVRAAHRLPEY